MNVEQNLDLKRKIIEERLQLILSRENSLLYEAMRYSVSSGGKRYRPLLAICAGECFSVELKEILPFACALELIHNYSLIHDDLPLMDNDDLRRGKPSNHKVFGEAVALLAGDSLLTLAFETMANACSYGNSSSQKYQVAKEICELAGARGMIGGQIIDITLNEEDTTEDLINELIAKKTGALITASVKTGAIFGNASDAQLGAMVEYGKNISFAFQIRDDILDYSSGEEKSKRNEPNYVAFFGLEESKYRLNEFVKKAINLLAEASLDSDELCFLAQMLLNVEREEK